MAYEAILVEKSDAVATVTLNRPKKLNAINATMLQELEQLFRELREDTRTRLVILLTLRGRSPSISVQGVLARAAGRASGQTWRSAPRTGSASSRSRWIR